MGRICRIWRTISDFPLPSWYTSYYPRTWFGIKVSSRKYMAVNIDKVSWNRICISVRFISHFDLLHSDSWMDIGLRILQLPESSALVINFLITFNQSICNWYSFISKFKNIVTYIYFRTKISSQPFLARRLPAQTTVKTKQYQPNSSIKRF